MTDGNRSDEKIEGETYGWVSTNNTQLERDAIAEIIGEQEWYGSSYFTIEAGDSCVEAVTQVDRLNRQGWIYPVPFVDYSAEKGRILYRVLCQELGTYNARRWAHDELTFLDEPERSATHSFLVNLFAYELSVPREDRTLPLEEILRKSLLDGPRYAKWLDGFKAYVLGKVLHWNLLSDEQEREYRLEYKSLKRLIVDRWVGMRSSFSPAELEFMSQLHARILDILENASTQEVPEDFLDDEIEALSEVNRFGAWMAKDVFQAVRAGHVYQRAEKLLRLRSLSRYQFTEELKRFIRDTFGATGDRYQQYLREGVEFSIDRLYRPNSLFPWRPPGLNLLEVSFEPVIFDPTALQAFRMETREYLAGLPEFVGIGVPWQQVDYETTKKAYEGPQWKLPPTKPAKRRLPCRLSDIPRELKEARLACIEHHASLLTIRSIDASVRKILLADKRYASRYSPETLKRKLEEAIGARAAWGTRYKTRTQTGHGAKRLDDEQSIWSYCRDFKKEGLTKPREILTILLEELHRRFPNVEAYKPTHFFSEWEVETPQGVLKPPRGHGLGMANSLTTLMQIIIERTVQRRCGVQPRFSAYLNDDAALTFEGRAALERWIREDRIVCAELSLKYKEKATFFSRDSIVLCETYASKSFEGVNRKEAFSSQTLLLLMKAINAAHARSLANTMNVQYMSRHHVDTVINYWGYVLYKGEHLSPIPAGGWFRRVKAGIDMSYFHLDADLTADQMRSAAWYSLKDTKLTFRPWEKPWKKKTRRCKYFDNEVMRWLGIDTISNQDTFRAETNAWEHTRAWRAYQKVLREKFGDNCNRALVTWREVYLDDANRRPEADVFPPRGERTNRRAIEFSTNVDLQLHHPYHSLGVVALCDLKRQRQAVEYTARARIGDRVQLSNAFNETALGAASRALAMRWGKRDPLKIKEWNRYLVPSFDGTEPWHNPIAVMGAADSTLGFYRFPMPITPIPAKQELIELRAAEYGGPLATRDWLEIAKVNPRDQVLVRITSRLWRPDVWGHSAFPLSSVIEYCQRYPGFGEYASSLDFIGGSNYFCKCLDAWARWSLAQQVQLDPEEDNPLDTRLARDWLASPEADLYIKPDEEILNITSAEPWVYSFLTSREIPPEMRFADDIVIDNIEEKPPDIEDVERLRVFVEKSPDEASEPPCEPSEEEDIFKFLGLEPEDQEPFIQGVDDW